MNAHSHHPLITGSDHSHLLFEMLTSHELKQLTTLSKPGKKNELSNKVIHYVYRYLDHYANFHAKMPIPNQDFAKRALALSVTFNPGYIEFILKQHPELISVVIETRTVTTTDPITKESFTAKWHFKLSHLLACENSKWGHHYLFMKLMDEYHANKHHEEISKFYSEAICWESGDQKGEKGPTAALIAILYNHPKFFSEIASKNCVLTLENGYDHPYNSINPCYIALQQAAKNRDKNHCFYQIINLYALSSSSIMIENCIKIIFNEATRGNTDYLEILLNSPSIHLEHFLNSQMFKAIDQNNLRLVTLLSQKMDEVQHLRNNRYQSPLFVATQKALDDFAFFPLVKHLLCCGYPLEDLAYSPMDLLKETIGDSFFAIFHKINPAKKHIKQYFKTKEKFDELISLCELENNSKLSLWDSSSTRKEKDPNKLLLKTAKSDKHFFNELVASYLPNGDDCMLNKRLTHFNDKKRYFTCLYNFVEKADGGSYLTASNLERIGDAVLSYRKSKAHTNRETDQEAFDLAIYFYKITLNHTDTSHECRLRVACKLQNINKHSEPSLDHSTRKKSFGYK